MNLREKSVLALLLLAFTAQVFFLIKDKSPTTDEVSFHMVNGFVNLETRDFRMSPATPPFLREWMVLPWFFWRPSLNLDKESWIQADSVPFAVDFFYGDHRGIANALLYSSRFMIYLLAMGLAVAVFLWSRRMYGTQGGLLSLGFFVFSPAVVAHSALATVDVGGALFYFLGVFLLYEAYERSPDVGFPWRSSACLGFGLASKFTSVLLLPLFLFLTIRKFKWRKGFWVFTGISLVAFGIVWATYFFEFKPLLRDVPRIDEKIAYVSKISAFLSGGNSDMRERLVNASLNLPIPLASWILGLAGIVRSHQADYLHFFLGERRLDQVWYHYLFAFGVKTTLGFLGILILRFFWMLRAAHRRLRIEDLYLLLPVGLLSVVSCFDTTGVGIRYLIPVFPFLCVWIGGLWTSETSRVFLSRKLWCLLLAGAHFFSAQAQFPNSLAYFNSFAGGPRGGYRYLRGSDLDWGQELLNLKKFVDREKISRLKTRLFGTRDEDFYGIPHVPIGESEFSEPRREIYAISANYLDGFQWTGEAEPVARIGNAIFIYDFRDVRR